MPLRSPKMNSFIFGFQRLVWCPKWTPASSSSFMLTVMDNQLPPWLAAPASADRARGFPAPARVRREGS